MGKANELRDEADRLFGRREYRKALAMYERLCAARPGEARNFVRLADLCIRLGAEFRAARAYAHAAVLFTHDGQYARAHAAVAQAIRLHPDDPDIALVARVVRQRELERDPPLPRRETQRPVSRREFVGDLLTLYEA